MTAARTTVLYIAGGGRSGSTLPGCILGQLPGFCYVGETVLGHAPSATRLCGCGTPVRECGIWTTVWRDAGDPCRALCEPELFGLARVARWRHLPQAFAPGGDRRLARRYGAHWYGGERLYAAIAAASEARVVVDSSKAVPYGRMLGLLPALDLRVVHLVRDARAAAYSWTRTKAAWDRSTGYMKKLDWGRATLFWILNNLGAELLGRHAPDRYLRLRYENFVLHPRESVARIQRLAGEPTRAPDEAGDGGGGTIEPPFAGDRSVVLHATHTVWGNPDRFQTGGVHLAPDENWRAAMPRVDRRFVTAAAWPFLVRYGYPTVVAPPCAHA